jgi:hypothetical protein
MEPILQDIADTYHSQTQVLTCRYNVEEGCRSSNTSNNFKVELALRGCFLRALPTLVLLNEKGKVLEQWEGLQSKEVIQEKLQFHLASTITSTPTTTTATATYTVTNNNNTQAKKKGWVSLGSWQRQEEDDSYMLANPSSL